MTTLLGAADLAWMQALQQQAMPGTAIIRRHAVTVDVYGGVVLGTVAIATVDARLYPVNSRAFSEAEAGNQLVSVTRWYVTLPVGTDITAADTITIGGTVYAVTEVNRGEMWQTAVRCNVSKLNEEAESTSTLAYLFDFSVTADSQYLPLL